MSFFKLLWLYLLIIVVFFISATTLSAAVTFDEQTSTLRITGPTDMSQVVEASNFIKESPPAYIELWGPGGDLRMGLQLGTLISKQDATVTVPAGKACISACAFAALGSKHIRVDGKLMLHRPYMTHVPNFYKLEESLAHMGRGYLMTAYYLEDRGYSRGLMRNIMDYTSPCKFMVYSDLVIKKPSDLIGWTSDNSRCAFLNRTIK